jgi:hypothetical protein
VRKVKRVTSYLLIFMFGFLFLKNLLPDVASYNVNNHNEIGHIHFYHVQNKTVQKTADVSPDLGSQKQTNGDEDCSAGKSIFAYSVTPVEVFEIKCPHFSVAFDLVFKIKNNFLTPYLEPKRKPPRYV